MLMLKLVKKTTFHGTVGYTAVCVVSETNRMLNSTYNSRRPCLRRCRSSPIWNSLPAEIATLQSLATFKWRLKHFSTIDVVTCRGGAKGGEGAMTPLHLRFPPFASPIWVPRKYRKLRLISYIGLTIIAPVSKNSHSPKAAHLTVLSSRNHIGYCLNSFLMLCPW